MTSGVRRRPAAPLRAADFDGAASDTVTILRSEAGRDPYERNLSDLISELSTRSETFRTRWAAHNVRIHRHGRQGVPPPSRRRPEPDLRHDGLSADTGPASLADSAEPGTRSAEGLNLLGSWAATLDEAPAPSETTDEARRA